MVYDIQVYWQLASRIWKEPSWSCSQAVSKPVWHIPLLCVQWKPPDDGQTNCPKHVEIHSKNKFQELVHLVGFIIGMERPSTFYAPLYTVWFKSSQNFKSDAFKYELYNLNDSLRRQTLSSHQLNVGIFSEIDGSNITDLRITKVVTAH